MPYQKTINNIRDYLIIKLIGDKPVIANVNVLTREEMSMHNGILINCTLQPGEEVEPPTIDFGGNIDMKGAMVVGSPEDKLKEVYAKFVDVICSDADLLKYGDLDRARKLIGRVITIIKSSKK